MEMILNTVRKIDNDQAKELSFGDEESLKEILAVAFFNKEDYDNLSLNKTKSNIKMTSQFGSVILKPEKQEKLPQGIVCMPVSIWANQLTGIIDNELIYKNIKVKVEVTGDHILNFNDMIKSIKKNKME